MSRLSKKPTESSTIRLTTETISLDFGHALHYEYVELLPQKRMATSFDLATANSTRRSGFEGKGLGSFKFAASLAAGKTQLASIYRAVLFLIVEKLSS